MKSTQTMTNSPMRNAGRGLKLFTAGCALALLLSACGQKGSLVLPENLENEKNTESSSASKPSGTKSSTSKKTNTDSSDQTK